MTTETGLVQGVDEAIDQLELWICQQETVIDLPVEHCVTPGLYRRTLRAPKDTLATTYIHLQEHQFVVTKGVIAVSHGGETVEIEAPYFGVTKIGTRRICLVLEDAEWTTYHPIPVGMTDVAEIEKLIFDYRTLPDGTNAKDRFTEALARKALECQQQLQLP